MRPVLSPSRRRLWRDQETLQLGRTPGRAVVLAGLDPGARRLLALLDGTRDRSGVLADAARVGCAPDRADELLRLLDDAGLLHDARERWPERLPLHDRDRLTADVASLDLVHSCSGRTALQRRDACAVVVVGGGRVGAPLAALLAAAGVGGVDVVDDGTVRPWDVAVGGLAPDDVGRPRGEAARERAQAWSGSCRPGPVPRPDLVVLTRPDAPDDPRALVEGGVPHLVVEVRETVGVVGPLVLPGRSACAHCLDLGRAERDPDWPRLVTQLSRPAPEPEACDALLAAAVSAQAALQAVALLDGGVPSSVGGTLELSLPGWRWRRRSWRPHPECSCSWPAGR